MKTIRKCLTQTVAAVVVICCFHGAAIALETATHSYLDDLIVHGNYGGWSLGSYLLNNLNFAKGVDEPIPQFDTVVNIIDLGGVTEDIPNWWSPYVRSMKHFHDPLVPDWNSAGFKGMQSSIIWAETKNQSWLLGNYSWPDARDYFYNALTATNANDHNTNYAECFRAMGQLMHLVQDVSVAEHTRNDFHYFYNYEDRVLNLQKEGKLESMLPSPAVSVDYSLLNRTGYNPGATIPIAGLFDADKYDGSNPGITTTTPVGLAEYSNANFYSNDTVESSKYTYPSLSNCIKGDWEQIPDPRNPNGTVPRKYYYTKKSDGTRDYKLAALSRQWTRASSYMPEEQAWLTVRDDNVYTDYAKRLIPKAVTYSAGLLNYFFRGQIDAGDAATILGSNDNDSNDRNAYITGISMKGVQNNTVMAGNPEDMGELQNGTDVRSNDKLIVSYQYTGNGQTTPTFGNSTTVAFSSYTTTYNFTGFKPPIPADTTDAKYMLVYRGKLGNENDAVAANSMLVHGKSIHLQGYAPGNLYWTSTATVPVDNIQDTSLIDHIEFYYKGDYILDEDYSYYTFCVVWLSEGIENVYNPVTKPVALEIYRDQTYSAPIGIGVETGFGYGSDPINKWTKANWTVKSPDGIYPSFKPNFISMWAICIADFPSPNTAVHDFYFDGFWVFFKDGTKRRLFDISKLSNKQLLDNYPPGNNGPFEQDHCGTVSDVP